MHPKREKQMNEMKRKLSQCLKQLRNLTSITSELRDVIFQLPLERKNTMLTRAFFVWEISEYIDELSIKEGLATNKSEDPKLFSDKIPFVAEMILCLQYVDNQIFDRKKGVTTAVKIRNNIIAHNLLERTLFEYIHNYIPNEADQVDKATRRALDLTDIGQYIEGKYNSLEYFDGIEQRYSKGKSTLPRFPEISDYLNLINFDVFVQKFKGFFPKKYQNFVHLYLLRASLTSSALFVIFGDLIMRLKGYNGAHQEKIKQYAFLFGMALQATNDVNDFVPSSFEKSTVAKNASDCFSDIKNKNITLPIMIHLLYLDNKIELKWMEAYSKGYKYMEGERKRRPNRKKRLILKLLVEGHGLKTKDESRITLEIAPLLLHYIIPIGQKWANMAKDCLDLDTHSGPLLADLTEISEDNKYYKYIYSFYTDSLVGERKYTEN